MESIQKLTKDIKLASVTLDKKEVRFLVDAYYQMQDNRIRSDGQIRSMKEEPHETLSWLSQQNTTLENEIKKTLDVYSMSCPAGRWMRSQLGIGPVIASGLLAHIDINMAPTVGHIWSFAGIEPSSKWNKGEKRPWNATLKTLCWKIGESFVKVSNKEDAFYGKLYKSKKEFYVKKNEDGGFSDRAKEIIDSGVYKRDTAAKSFYEKGVLPPGHINAMAKRYAVKIFLSHMHDVWRRSEGLDVPKPFALAHLNHVHMIDVPYCDTED